MLKDGYVICLNLYKGCIYIVIYEFFTDQVANYERVKVQLTGEIEELKKRLQESFVSWLAETMR